MPLTKENKAISDNIVPDNRMVNRQITINWLRSVDEIDINLWRQCISAQLEGRWWYEVLEKSGLEDQFHFYYGLILENKEPVGIVPAFLNDVPIELVAPDGIAAILRIASKIFPACGYQRTFFVGSPCADEGSIGLLPGKDLAQFTRPIHDAVLEQAKKLKAPMIVWKDFPQSTEKALDNLCADSPVFKMASYPGTILHLKEPTMQSYLKNLKGSRRYNLQKNLKRSKSKFSFIAEVIQNPDDKTLDEIFPLFWQTYEKGKTKFERLNKEFFSLIGKQKESYFVTLRQSDDNKIVAFMLCFLLDGKVINKFIGLDYSLPRDASLYYRLWEAALEWTVSTGAKIFQSGQTGYRFKLDTGNTLEPLFNYCQHRNPLINMIYAQVSRTISWETLDEDLKTYLKAHPDKES